MIEQCFRGEAISSIPEDAFTDGISQSGINPALVLASPKMVPGYADERWRLVKQDVSGHSGRTFFSAVRELPIRPEMLPAVRGIADESFTLEHMGYFEWLSASDKEVVYSDYLRTLIACDLTCSATNLCMLTQDLYPVDASLENLRKLSTNSDAFTGQHADGLVMLITGPVI